MISRAQKKFIGSLAITALALLGALAIPASAAAAPLDTDCSYADSTGGGKYPTSICWINFDGYNEAEALTVDGQDLTVELGDYTATFTVNQRSVSGWNTRGVVTSPAQYTLGAPGYYHGITGSPVLYATSGATTFGAVNVLISDFSITLNGAPVAGYSLVSASAETLDGFVGNFGEYNSWTSDVPLTMIDHASEFSSSGGCGLPPSGNGTTSVLCTGGAAGGTNAHGVILSAPSATRISAAMYMSSRGEREAVAFGIQTARVSVDKAVVGRVAPADSFDLSITSFEGPELSSVTTGTGNSASTGSEIVIPSGPVALAEARTSGAPSPLEYYDTAWSCANATTGSTTVLPSGDDPSQSLTLAVGDDVSCVITNTALATGLSLSKTVDLVDAVLGDSATYEFEVTNTGAIPLDSLTIEEDEFSGSGSLSSVTCPTTSLGVGESTTCSATYEVTQEDVDAGFVSNTATASARAAGTEVVATSGPSDAEFGSAGTGALNVTKTVDTLTAVAGDEVTYTLAATNNGTVTLSTVTLDEESFSGEGSLSALDCDAVQPATLAPGAALTCTATYVVTAGDGGALTNTAVGAATGPSGTPLSGDASATLTIISPIDPPVTPPIGAPVAQNTLPATGLAEAIPTFVLAGLLGLSGLVTMLILRRSRAQGTDAR